MEAYATAHSLDPSVGADRMRHEAWEYYPNPNPTDPNPNPNPP